MRRLVCAFVVCLQESQVFSPNLQKRISFDSSMLRLLFSSWLLFVSCWFQTMCEARGFAESSFVPWCSKPWLTCFLNDLLVSCCFQTMCETKNYAESSFVLWCSKLRLLFSSWLVNKLSVSNHVWDQRFCWEQCCSMMQKAKAPVF